MAPTTPLHTIPVSKRPVDNAQWFKAVLFFIFFQGGMTLLNATQWLALPLRIFSHEGTFVRDFYERIIISTKAGFGVLIVFITQLFAPCEFVFTVEPGTSPEDVKFETGPDGKVTELHLPKRSVLIANHQVYCDWLYIWCMLYWARLHEGVLIVLKKLPFKHIPIVGWGMQFFRFIFLDRSWAKDQVPLTKALMRASTHAKESSDPLAFMIFPEGTLVSAETRGWSQKYAKKTNLKDPENILLPRSTGLLYCLRAMAPAIPDVKLLDLTVGYPGVPRGGYGQDYYTLRSIFFAGVPPPQLHVHIQVVALKDIPIGELKAADGELRTAEATTEEAKVFDDWLRDRWYKKDALMSRFIDTERMGPAKGDGKPWEQYRLPIRARSWFELGDAFSWFAPVLLYAAARFVKAEYEKYVSWKG